MINIYVCEDNEKQLNIIVKYIKNCLLMEELDMKLVLATKDPYQVIATAQDSHVVGLYFLDIDLGTDMTGLSLAQEIRKFDPRGFIIFITSHSEMSFLTFQYKVEALDFIIKDHTSKIQSRIIECIMNVNERYTSLNNNVQKNFTIKINEKSIVVDYKDILFFETSPNIHKVILHAINRQIEFNGKLKNIEEQLDDHFYRCHRSYIVNLDNIKEIDYSNYTIEMINGEKCLFSTRLKKKLISSIQQFAKKV